MAEVNVHQAKTQLSRLLRRVQAGEEIVIARGGVPVARLFPVRPAGMRRLGQDQGAYRVPEDFDAPLPEDLLHLFER